MPEVGMLFTSEDEAYRFYSNYAKEKGFTVRKGKTVKAPKTKQLKRRQFVCSREGQKNLRSGKKTKFEKKSTRSNCNAKLVIVALKDGQWKTTKAILEHNHELDQCQTRVRNKSEAFPTDDAGEARMEEDTARVDEVITPDAMDFENSTYASNHRTEDVPNTRNCFIELQKENESFHYKIQDGTRSQICNVLCWDDQSRKDYECFGDVLVLDTTFQVEDSGMICAPFWGINNHQKQVLFGCGFLHSEAEDSFVWLLKTFIEAVGNHQHYPKTFYTNVSGKMDRALEVFPKTKHCIAKSYLLKDVQKQLGKYFDQEPDFESHLGKCIFSCTSRLDFEQRLKFLLEKYNLEENPWFNTKSTLYKSWEKWSDSSCEETFTAGIQSMLDGKISVGDVIFKGSTRGMTLTMLAKKFLDGAEKLRAENYVECRTMNPPKSRKGIEAHAETLFTPEIFKLFKKELHDSLSLAVKEDQRFDDVSTFVVTEGQQKDRPSYVCFKRVGTSVGCSCKKFEQVGILCAHALKVLNANNIFQVPDRYTLRRWMKSAKESIKVDQRGEDVPLKGERSSKKLATPLSEKLQQETESVHVNLTSSSTENNEVPCDEHDAITQHQPQK